jgi:hypothetical protein
MTLRDAVLRSVSNVRWTRTRPLEVAGDEPLAIGCPTAIRQVVHSDQQPVLLGDGAAALSPSRVSRRTIVI